MSDAITKIQVSPCVILVNLISNSQKIGKLTNIDSICSTLGLNGTFCNVLGGCGVDQARNFC